MQYPEFANETEKILWHLSLELGLAEDSNQDTNMVLMDIGSPEGWGEELTEKVDAMTNPMQRAMLRGFRFYVISQRGAKVWFTHANRLDVMAGVFDQLALKKGMDGALAGYLAKRDPELANRGY